MLRPGYYLNVSSSIHCRRAFSPASDSCRTRGGGYVGGILSPLGCSCWVRLEWFSSWVCPLIRMIDPSYYIRDSGLSSTNHVHLLAMTLGPRPYYWPNTKEISYGNSPPIATRTGFMALACMPFLMYENKLSCIHSLAMSNQAAVFSAQKQTPLPHSPASPTRNSTSGIIGWPGPCLC